MSLAARFTRQSDSRRARADLQAGFAEAMAFPTDTEAVRPTDGMLQRLAAQETAGGHVALDADGLTPALRAHLLAPARTIMARFRETRRAFDVALEPRMPDLRALEAVEAEIVAARERAARDEQDAAQRLEADHRFVRAREEFQTAEDRLLAIRPRHGNREANMAAYNPLYWLALLCIGAAEWLINYDVFYLFAGIAAVAAGATIVMGVLLAFAAHGHGTLLKQWSWRFGPERERIERWNDLRLLALSTFSLLVVLAAAAGSRYAAVMHQLSGQPAMNLLGAEAQVAVDPMRDVLLSLLWNVMAWAVGVFIAYLAHDPDPDFMNATAQWQRQRRRYDRLRRPLTRKAAQIHAQLAREIEQLETAARTRAAEVTTERGLLSQVETHQRALRDALLAAVQDGASRYRAVVVELATTQPLTFERTGPDAGPIPLAAFRDAPLRVTPAMIAEEV